MENLILNELQNIVETKVISFHMPGHKLGKIYEKLGYKNIVEKLYKMDTTEIPGTDNLHCPEGAIKKSQEKASKVFESESTYFLVNGSTCGIEASIMTVCNPKDKIIVNRDCHQSVINACILGDIEPIYISPKIDNLTNILEGIEVDDVINIIDNNLDAKAILLTYPTYYGMTFDLEKICEYAHKHNMTVIIDEAHGAHLSLSKKLPKTALEQGTDIVIQSTHKTLPAFTQSSMIHTQGDRIDKDRLCNILRMVESSSPSYILLSSLELATDICKKYGIKLMDDLLIEIDKFKNSLKNNEIFGIRETNDKTKVFIYSKNREITGYKLANILREKFNIQVELSNYYGVLLICTLGNDKEDFKILQDALNNIQLHEECVNSPIVENRKYIKYPKDIPIKILNPREAFYKGKKSVKIYESIGKVCGEYIIPYPPGISLLSPGEIITKDIIDYIMLCNQNGMEVNGIKDSDLEFIQIIE
ncbi:MAG: aminotransferase class I/II-fold pyridoxal phosphate-dependent enzyme [Romboutsia sp.]